MIPRGPVPACRCEACPRCSERERQRFYRAKARAAARAAPPGDPAHAGCPAGTCPACDAKAGERRDRKFNAIAAADRRAPKAPSLTKSGRPRKLPGAHVPGEPAKTKDRNVADLLPDSLWRSYTGATLPRTRVQFIPRAS